MPTSAQSAPTPMTIDQRLEGLNHLRFLAAILVFMQHTLSSCQLDDWIDIGGFRIGRIGTAIFFLLSGFFAAATTRRPVQWLHDRVVMLFPPYWIVTIGGFVLAGVTGMKSFDSWQVVSQMAGTGYFTHGDHIVNIASWFMSPLLLLYLAVTLTRIVSVRIMTSVLIAGLAAAACLKTPEFATLRCHGATFFLAFAVGACPRDKRMSAAGGMLAVMALLCIAQPEFRYGAVASLLLLAALPVRQKIPLCNRFAKISYEWFLVHGLCLAAICHLTSSRLLIVLGGVFLSVAAAIILQRTTRALMNRLARPVPKPLMVAESTVDEILTMVDHALPDLMTQHNSAGPAVITVDASVHSTTVRPASKRRPLQRI